MASIGQSEEWGDGAPIQNKQANRIDKRLACSHLNGGDVAVDSNGMVVGHYKSNGQYVEGGQLGGMSIEDARAFDEHASKYGMQ